MARYNSKTATAFFAVFLSLALIAAALRTVARGGIKANNLLTYTRKEIP